MVHKYILDTHALVWYLEGNKLLGKQAKAIIDAAESQMVLPLIALAEAAFIIERGRTSIPTVPDLLSSVFADSCIEIYAITLNIFEWSLTPKGLQIPELHDRLIVSTGLYLQDLGYTVSILTKDGNIASAGVLPVIW